MQSETRKTTALTKLTGGQSPDGKAFKTQQNNEFLEKFQTFYIWMKAFFLDLSLWMLSLVSPVHV